MPLGPMNKGDTAPRAHFLFKQGTIAFPLTGLSANAVVVHLWQASSQIHKRGGGSIVYTDAPNGKCDYVWNPEDTNTPGLWDVWAEVITTDGPQCSTNTETLEVTDRVKGFNSKNFKGRLVLEVPVPPT